MPSIPLISIPVYDDEPVFPFIGDWKTERAIECSRTCEGVTSDSGIAAVTKLQRSATWSVTVKEILFTRRAIIAALKFLKETGGRVTRFWMPSLKRDFILDGAQPAGYFLSCLPGQFHGTADQTSLEYPALMIMDLEAARWHARQLVGVTVDGDGNETLQVAGPVPALSAGAIVSLMTLARFSTEDIELDLAHTERAAVEFHVESLPEETVVKAITSGGVDGDISEEDGILQPDP